MSGRHRDGERPAGLERELHNPSRCDIEVPVGRERQRDPVIDAHEPGAGGAGARRTPLDPETRVERKRAVDRLAAGFESAHQTERWEQRSLDLGNHALGQHELRAADAPGRFQHGGAVPVPAPNHLGVAGGTQGVQAPAVVTGDECTEDRFTVEVRQAQPQDSAPGIHQSSRAGVADQAEITDRWSSAHRPWPPHPAVW